MCWYLKIPQNSYSLSSLVMTPKSIFLIILTLIAVSSSWGRAPSAIVGKKVTVNGSVSELNTSFNHQFFFVSSVNHVGLYNIGQSNEDWSQERYHYRKIGEQSAQLTIINFDGHQTRLVLSFDSPISGSVTGAYYDLEGNEQWSDLVGGTWTAEDFDRSEIPEDELPTDPSGYFAPLSIGGGTLSAQDKYWPVYDETISFTTSGSFSVSVTNGEDDPTGSGSYSYSKTGTNSATLSYSIDGAGISFEYALQFTDENTGIYSKFADYGGGSTDITTGPFSLSGVAIPEQFDWEEYDDFEESTLDSSKWLYSTNYFVGNEPTMANGRVELTGLTSEHTHSNTFLILEDLDGIVGLEGDIWLPSNAPMDTGVLIGIGDAGVHVGWIDLWVNENNTWLDITLENSSSGEKIDFNRDAELGVVYRVGIIKGEDKTALFLNGEKIAEVTTWDSENLDFLFRGVNDVGSPFTAYLDNVRVIRDWEDYDDFSSGSLDSSKWDLAKWDGGEFPVLEGGKLKFTGQPNSSSSVNVATSAMLAISSDASVGDPTSQSPHSILEFKESQDLEGIELTFSIPSGVPNQMGFGLYAVNYQAMFNSQSDSEEESAIPFNMDLWADNSLAATLEFDAKDPTTGVEQGIDKSISFDSSYRVSFIRGDSQISFYMNGDLIGEFPYSDVGEHFIVRAMNEINQPFTTYLENVRVLRRSQGVQEPDPVAVVSDPNGQPVVVQVGDEYKWNDTLDGVTLWGVWEDDEDGWIGATLKYENGVQKASIGLTDELGSNLEVNHPYTIDENGMIKVTEDTAFQYYQVIAVENGVIVTADDSSFPLSDTSKFFTTRTAAEEYYYSKANPKDWMWFDHYPWVYSEEEGDWLYFYPSGGTLMYWSNKSQAWRQFN
jgi:hypothetical protein